MSNKIGRLRYTNISVDNFQPQASVQFYLLTHVHADHLVGLNHEWNQGIIYCSEISKKLLLNMFAIDESLIVPFDVGSTFTLFVDQEQKVPIHITTLDANHSAGSVMYFLEGYFGTIFYTGDFRYHDGLLPDDITGKPVDWLHLDNTYLHPDFNFPSKEEATQMVIDVIKTHLEYKVVIGMDSFGKEDLLVALAKTFNTQIVVNQARMDIISIIYPSTKLFTTDVNAGFIRVVSKNLITIPWTARQNEKEPTIGIIVSGRVCDKSLNMKTAPPVYYIPYSLHSNYEELKKFVARVRPRNIHPLTTSKEYAVYSKELDQFLDPTPSEPVEVPESIYSTAQGLRTHLPEIKKKSGIKFLDTNNNNNQVDKNPAQRPRDVPREWKEEAKNLILKFYPEVKDTEDMLNFVPAMSKEEMDYWRQKMDALVATSDTDRKILDKYAVLRTDFADKKQEDQPIIVAKPVLPRRPRTTKPNAIIEEVWDSEEELNHVSRRKRRRTISPPPTPPSTPKTPEDSRKTRRAPIPLSPSSQLITALQKIRVRKSSPSAQLVNRIEKKVLEQQKEEQAAQAAQAQAEAQAAEAEAAKEDSEVHSDDFHFQLEDSHDEYVFSPKERKKKYLPRRKIPQTLQAPQAPQPSKTLKFLPKRTTPRVQEFKERHQERKEVAGNYEPKQRQYLPKRKKFKKLSTRRR